MSNSVGVVTIAMSTREWALMKYFLEWGINDLHDGYWEIEDPVEGFEDGEAMYTHAGIMYDVWCQND